MAHTYSDPRVVFVAKRTLLVWLAIEMYILQCSQFVKYHQF
jgi:hypothetical protein